MTEREEPDRRSGGGAGAAADTDARGAVHVAAAWAVFETFRDEVTQLLCEVRAGDTTRAKKLAPAASDLAKAVSRLAEEAARLSARPELRGTRDGDVSLDLAAARAEIRRRLAQLRNAAE